MIVTVFRSRLAAGHEEQYRARAAQLSGLARTMPGYVAHKTYVAEDGERLTLVEFADREGMDAWARHPEHAAGKREGRETYFSDYRVQVCTVERDSADRRSRG